MKKTIKMIWVSLLIVVMAIGVTACGGSSMTSLPSPDESQPLPSQVAPSGDLEQDKALEEVDPVEEYSIEDDPIGMLLSSDETAREYGGVFLLRDERLYTLASNYYKTPGVRYSSKHTTYWNDKPCAWFYNSYDFNKHRDRFCSYSDVPIPVFSDGDQMVAYSLNNIPVVKLCPTTFLGYRTTFFGGGNNRWYVDLVNGGQKQVGKCTDFQMVDQAGNDITDIGYADSYGETLTISWYNGTVYTELQLPADCVTYEADLDNAIELQGELTKEGYVVYDLSGLPAGYYLVLSRDCDSGGLIEIP